jgi:cytochrome P450
MHDEYGPIVRIAPNELSYTTASAWKDIYGFRPGQPQNPKDQAVLPKPHPDQADNIIRSNDADHSRFRRLMSHAFSAKALDEQQPLIMFYIDLLINRLKENAAHPQNMVAWYNWTTFDIISDLTFGESFHGLRDQQWHPWVETVVEALEVGAIVNAISRYGLDGIFAFLIPRSMREKFDQLWIYPKEKVATRLQSGTERPDFMSYVMRNDKHGREMNKEEITSNAEVFVVAGSETTASLLSGATYYLCENPQVLEKVTAEVRDEFESDQDITANAVNKLDYLQAVLSESLRR